MWLVFHNPKSLLVFAALGAIAGGMFLILNYDWRGMWPSHVGLTPEGVALKFPRRPDRAISWEEIRTMAVMPATLLADEWLRIWYRSGGEETQLYVIGQTAHAVVREFQTRLAARQRSGVWRPS